MGVVNAVSASASKYSKRLATSSGRKASVSHRHKLHVIIHDIYLGIGPIYFPHAYPIKYSSFPHLYQKLKINKDAAEKNMTTYVSNEG
jgi:hypothetical protein